MKKLVLILLVFISFRVSAQQATVTIGNNSNHIISKFIYGSFAEHLGRCIYDGFYKDGKIRMDVVHAMKEIQIPVMRWPGGCFADQYHWKDGIGDKKKRPVTVNTQWGMVTDDNSFGSHEFMELCKLIGCEPYIGANLGTGTPEELEGWTEYLNFDGPSSLAQLRKKNGHAEPFHVAYWGIGNESWGCGGRMLPEYYGMKYRQFAQFCKSYPGSELKRIASGANAEDYNWTEQVMKYITLWNTWGISVHYYCEPTEQGARGLARGFGEEGYFTGLFSCLKMDEIIRKHLAIMNKYDPHHRVALVVDEWGVSTDVDPGTNPDFLYQQNSLRDALIAASTLNIFNNHCERVKMANLAQAVNVLQALVLTKGDQMLLTPTYYIFDLYKVHHDAKWLPVKIESPYYHFGKDSIPSVNASASIDSNHVTHISIVNLDPLYTIPVNLVFDKINGINISGQVLTSEHYTDVNTFTNPKTVTIHSFNDFQKNDNNITVNVPSKSVIVLTIK